LRLALALTLLFLTLAAHAADARYRGRFYFGPDVQVFEPCSELKAYWVEGDAKTLKPLIARSKALSENRGKDHLPIYVELTGRIDTRAAREGAAEDYDGYLHVRRVLRMSSSIPKRCAE
jgi:hypothetical protein